MEQPNAPKKDGASILGEVSTSVKILEDRYLNLRKKTQLTDQTLIETQREFSKEKRIINEEILEMKTKIWELIEKLNEMEVELSDVVKNKDFTVLNKYVNFWNPGSFITREEAERLIKDNDKV